MKMLSKAALVATTGAMLVTALPADARSYRRHNDGISAGDVLIGALILGGIAAVASSSSRNRYDDQDGFSRRAVDQCMRAARNEASRYGGWARIKGTPWVNPVRGGYEVGGRVVVEDDYGFNKGSFNCVTRHGGVEYVNIYGLGS